jgi:hypothetical protein
MRLYNTVISLRANAFSVDRPPCQGLKSQSREGVQQHPVSESGLWNTFWGKLGCVGGRWECKLLRRQKPNLHCPMSYISDVLCFQCFVHPEFICWNCNCQWYDNKAEGTYAIRVYPSWITFVLLEKGSTSKPGMVVYLRILDAETGGLQVSGLTGWHRRTLYQKKIKLILKNSLNYLVWYNGTVLA